MRILFNNNNNKQKEKRRTIFVQNEIGLDFEWHVTLIELQCAFTKLIFSPRLLKETLFYKSLKTICDGSPTAFSIISANHRIMCFSHILCLMKNILFIYFFVWKHFI